MRVKHILIQDPQKTIQQAKIKQKTPPSLSPSQAFLQKITNKILSQNEFFTLCLDDEILSAFASCFVSLHDFASIGLDLEKIQINGQKEREKDKKREEGGINQEKEQEEGQDGAKDEVKICLGSRLRKWREQVFCFVDLETTDANPLKGNVLELGAILCNGAGEVLGRFESCVKNTEIPPIVQEITGIREADVLDAPDIREVLGRFREFLGSSIFVAHNVKFDYGFLDVLYQKHFGIGLYNQSLCTIKMAQKLIQSPKFSLPFLNEFLGIHTPISHRAYADAYTCKEIFLSISKLLPHGISSSQSLLNFCR